MISEKYVPQVGERVLFYYREPLGCEAAGGGVCVVSRQSMTQTYHVAVEQDDNELGGVWHWFDFHGSQVEIWSEGACCMLDNCQEEYRHAA